MRTAFGMDFARVRDAVAWRLRDLLGDKLIDRSFVRMAHRWRPLVDKPVYIGITGSAGKTTTKELLLEMLSGKRRGIGNPASLNALPEIAKTLLRVRRTHDFCVAELDETRPGELDDVLALLRPSVGIVTVVGDDHFSAYGSRDAIAAELGKLVASLPPTGTAVLNADDELVLAMAARCASKVITYGTSPAAELRAEDVSAAWPDRLQMTLVRGAERVRLRTQLCGAHWVPSVLGAIGGGLATGLTLQECAAGIASVAPFEGRMQPITTPEGVTFIRDDFKAPLWTVGASLEFMKAARATRKVIVIGTLSDCGTSTPQKYQKVAQIVQEIAEVTIFVGPWASHVLKTRKRGKESALRVFGRVRDAAEYVNAVTRKGDLVLLKGTVTQDHLLRIIMARDNEIACWRDDCERRLFCTDCSLRNRTSGPPVLLRITSIAEAAPGMADGSARGATERVIIGLGNPDPRYAGTPHNIGYAVVDRLASSYAFNWNATPGAWIARGSAKGRDVCLIKVRTAMNNTGAGLKQLAESMSLDPEQCVLVHDDLDIPIGVVRSRLRGGAGGHRGVASILEAFQSDAFRRVKIGVGREAVAVDPAEYVLTPFAEGDRDAIEQAIRTAEARSIEIVVSAEAKEHFLGR